MREIKFRVWNKHTNEMRYNILNIGNFDRKYWEWMQFTGLKDKNGKEIYEGDIVQVYSRVGRGWRDRGIHEVKYAEILARFLPYDINHPEVNEVIGNIYKSPELLNTQNQNKENEVSKDDMQKSTLQR